MPTSQSPRHPDVTTAELIGGVEKRDLVIVDYDSNWVDLYREYEAHIRRSLSTDVVLGLEHIGSTSVPGLAAKPIIDILLVVPDIAAEEDYLRPLLDAGYVLRVREPRHRMFRTPQLDVHLHLLQIGDPQAEEYLLLRDHLRRHDEDRDLYAQTKRDLVTREWSDMNAYADAKTPVINQIKQRARSK